MLSILVPEGASLFSIDPLTVALVANLDAEEAKPSEVVGWVQQVQIRGEGEKTEIWYEIGMKSASVGLGDGLDLWVPASSYLGPFGGSADDSPPNLGAVAPMCVRVGLE